MKDDNFVKFVISLGIAVCLIALTSMIPAGGG
jgi:hypothetical protein